MRGEVGRETVGGVRVEQERGRVSACLSPSQAHSPLRDVGEGFVLPGAEREWKGWSVGMLVARCQSGRIGVDAACTSPSPHSPPPHSDPLTGGRGRLHTMREGWHSLFSVSVTSCRLKLLAPCQVEGGKVASLILQIKDSPREREGGGIVEGSAFLLSLPLPSNKREGEAVQVARTWGEDASSLSFLPAVVGGGVRHPVRLKVKTFSKGQGGGGDVVVLPGDVAGQCGGPVVQFHVNFFFRARWQPPHPIARLQEKLCHCGILPKVRLS